MHSSWCAGVSEAPKHPCEVDIIIVTISQRRKLRLGVLTDEYPMVYQLSTFSVHQNVNTKYGFSLKKKKTPGEAIALVLIKRINFTSQGQKFLLLPPFPL